MSDQPISSVPTDDESAEYNFRELIDALNEVKDFILTIPSDQVEELKEGLQARKAKDNYAMRARGIIPPAEMLSFLVYPARDSNSTVIEGQTCVRVKLRPRKSIDIIKMEVPDPNV